MYKNLILITHGLLYSCVPLIILAKRCVLKQYTVQSVPLGRIHSKMQYIDIETPSIQLEKQQMECKRRIHNATRDIVNHFVPEDIQQFVYTLYH